jgi:hypothetical protein
MRNEANPATLSNNNLDFVRSLLHAEKKVKSLSTPLRHIGGVEISLH